MRDILAQVPHSYREFEEQTHANIHPLLTLNLLSIIPEAISKKKMILNGFSVDTKLTLDEVSGALISHKTVNMSVGLKNNEQFKIDISVDMTVNIGVRVGVMIFDSTDEDNVIISSTSDSYGNGIPTQLINLVKFMGFTQVNADAVACEKVLKMLGVEQQEIINPDEALGGNKQDKDIAPTNSP
jgi:hypothetical protein